jgi:hypothetical protein
MWTSKRFAFRILSEHVGNCITNFSVNAAPRRLRIASLDAKQFPQNRSSKTRGQSNDGSRFGRHIPPDGELEQLAVATNRRRLAALMRGGTSGPHRVQRACPRRDGPCHGIRIICHTLDVYACCVCARREHGHRARTSLFHENAVWVRCLV